VRRAVVIVAVLAGLLASAAPASAAFPGRNGDLVFTRANAVWTAHADGTGQRKLAESGSEPVWSADGRRIVFTRGDAIWVMDADGRVSGG
jgi:hypothetical protein